MRCLYHTRRRLGVDHCVWDAVRANDQAVLSSARAFTDRRAALAKAGCCGRVSNTQRTPVGAPGARYLKRVISVSSVGSYAGAGAGAGVGAATATPSMVGVGTSLSPASVRGVPTGRGLARLRRVVRKQVLMNALARGKEHSASPLAIWEAVQRRNNVQARALPAGSVMCTCIPVHPMAGYVPRKLCVRGQLQWELFDARKRAISAILGLMSLM